MGGTGQLAQQNKRTSANNYHLVTVVVVDHQVASSSSRSRRLWRSSKIIFPIKQPFVFSIIVFSKIILRTELCVVKRKSSIFLAFYAVMLSAHISHWLITVLIAVS